MPNAKLSPVQAEVLTRLTNEWRGYFDLVGRFSSYRGRGGSHITLTALVSKGYAERRKQRRWGGEYDYEYRLAQKGEETA